MRGRGRGLDDVDEWRLTARRFAAILNADAALREGRLIPQPDREALERDVGRTPWGIDPAPSPQRADKILPTMALDEAVVPHVRVGLRSSSGRAGPLFEVWLGGGSLLGGLCGGLLTTLAGGVVRFVPCHACGQPHAPRGQAGHRHSAGSAATTPR